MATTVAGCFATDNVWFIVNNATAYGITDFADGMAYKESKNPGRELIMPAGAQLKVIRATEVSPGNWEIVVEQTGTGGL